jgi:hypothetical protein
MFKRINHKLLFILALTMALLLGISSIAMAAVWTVPEDAAPGTVVTIYGSNNDGLPGYVAGQLVNVAVAGPHDPAYDMESELSSCNAPVIVGENGSWSCTVKLWDDPEWAVGTYTYIATSVDANEIPIEESGTFTDGNAEFSGTVTDTDGNPISGATISCTAGCNEATSTTTDSNGDYPPSGHFKPSFEGSDTATLTLTASKTGYTPIDFSINVTHGNAYTHNFKLTAISSCSPPSVTTQPSTQTVTYGIASVDFISAASGSPTPTVQWQVSIDGGVTFTNIGGATNTTLTISSPTVAMSGYQYQAVFSNYCGGTQTATSNAATLTVNKATPTIIEWPSASVITYGQALSDSTLTGGSASVSGSFAFTDDTIKPDAGTYSASVTFIPDDTANYKTVIGNVDVTVNQKLLTATITVDAKYYDGDKDASISGCTLSGVVDDEDVTCDFLSATATFAEKDAGTWAASASGLNLSGTATLSNYSFYGTGSGTGTINQRVLTATITVADKYFDYTTGATITGCTMNNVVYGETVGCDYSGATANFNNALAGNGKPVTATGLAMTGDKAVLANYSFDHTGSGTGNILHWRIDGFYQPVDMGEGIFNTVKGGSTVPLKFKIFAGDREITDIGVVHFTATAIVCPSGTYIEDPITVLATGGTSIRYDSVAGQFIFNWQTPKKPGACYSITLTTDDGSQIEAYFKLK